MRKVELLTIEDEGRDKGKVFQLTEMPTARSEKWAARALLALLRSGAEVPDEVAQAGLAGVASMGMAALSGLAWKDIEPLLDEMMTCVKVVPSPGVVRDLNDAADDIEEVGTLFTIRKKVLELHLGFSITDKLSTLASSVGKSSMIPQSV